MITDFKIASILRDGAITTIKAVFYEGEYVDVFDEDREIWITKYRRIKKLREYNTALSGTRTDLEILNLLTTELSKDKKRIAIDVQKA